MLWLCCRRVNNLVPKVTADTAPHKETESRALTPGIWLTLMAQSGKAEAAEESGNTDTVKVLKAGVGCWLESKADCALPSRD